MSLNKKEKKYVKEACAEGNTVACRILGKDQALKHKSRFTSDANGSGIRLGLIIAFWASVLALYVLSFLEFISFEMIWLISPYILAFGVLMVKGEQLEKMPKAFWIAGIIIPITLGLFIGFFLFFVSFDWAMCLIMAWFIIVMIVYILVRGASGADARMGVLLWITLISAVLGLGLYAMGVVFFYMSIYTFLILYFWIIAGFLNALVLILLVRALWKAQPAP